MAGTQGDYDFRSLSHVDFERLVSDLLSAEFGHHFSPVPVGRDEGMDAVYWSNETPNLNSPEWVVQCKHFRDSGLTKLKSTLKTEVAKVKKLNPTRYTVATSVSLTSTHKREISSLFPPGVLNVGDVLGAQDLNAMLRRHEEVHRAHYKLWLHSTAMLDYVVHANSLTRSRLEFEEMKRQAELYVPGSTHARARATLRDQRVAIITGAPGVGKTVLASALAIEYASAGFRFELIESDIRQSFRSLDSDESVFFLYDDFLGQTSLGERLLKNEDNALVRFMSACRVNQNKRFVLTTREYLLNEALQLSERLRHAGIQADKCVVKIEDYGRAGRAQILYNHLWYSRMERPYLDAVLRNKEYLKISDHKGFSPRIVELTCRGAEGRQMEPDQFPATMIRYFENPTLLWDTAFARHLSECARELCLVLLTLPRKVHLGSLRTALDAFRGSAKGKSVGVVAFEAEFRDAVDRLDGSFITTSKGLWDVDVVVEFANPSIRDYLTSALQSLPGTIARLTQSSIYFEQLQYILSRGEIGRPSEKIGAIAREASRPDVGTTVVKIFTLPGCTLISTVGGRHWLRNALDLEERFQLLAQLARDQSLSAEYLPEIQSYTQVYLAAEKMPELRYDTRLGILKAVTIPTELPDTNVRELLLAGLRIAPLTFETGESSEFEAAAALLTMLGVDNKDSLWDEMREAVDAEILDNLEEQLRSAGKEDVSQLGADIVSAARTLGLNSQRVSERVEQYIDEIHARQAEYDEDYGSGSYRSVGPSSDRGNDAAIDQMFRGLG